MDNELYNLCKQVYEATEWIDDSIGYYMRYHKPSKRAHKVNRWRYDEDSRRYANKLETVRFEEENEVALLYTSDYLLEKLPKEINHHNKSFELTPTRANTMWSTGYFTFDRLDTLSVIADTPLKALLKLTLILHKKKLL